MVAARRDEDWATPTCVGMLVELLGGQRLAGKLIGVSDGAISKWLTEDRCPLTAELAAQLILEQREVQIDDTLDALLMKVKAWYSARSVFSMGDVALNRLEQKLGVILRDL